MRFTILTCLLAISLPLLRAEPQVLESVRKSVDGIETPDKRFIWDDDGLRVEEKSWWEKGVDWFNGMLDGNRWKRDAKFGGNGTTGANEDEDQNELIRVNAKIIFYKSVIGLASFKFDGSRNGTRIVDIENGPVIRVEPNGQMQLDFRNGTVRELAKGRAKRFAKLDDLYMAHGYEFGQRDAADFGQARQEKELMSQMKAEDRADTDDDDGDDWRWAEGNNGPKDTYWDKPLYAGNPVPQQKGQNQQQQAQQIFQAPSAQKPWAKNPFNGDSNPNANSQQKPQNGGRIFNNGQVQQSGGGQSQNSLNEPIHPPSPSPASWLKSRMQSQQPLSSEELELARELIRRLEKQQQNGNGNGVTSDTNSGRNGQSATSQNPSGSRANANQNPQVPKWAQPKRN